MTKKELKSYFDNPTAYIVIIVFLMLWEFLFFRDVFLIGESSLRLLFNLLPWLFLILIPAITMASISQEKSGGTLEYLLTAPISELEIILGKYFGAMIFTAIILLFIFPIALSLNMFGRLDWGVVIAQYLAGVFMGSVLVSLGIFISSLFKNQISSLLVSVVADFFIIVLGFELVTARLPLYLASIFEKLSVTTHFLSMSRGVMDLRDLWYFISSSLIFLSLAYLLLLKQKYGNRFDLYQKYFTAVILFIAIAVMTNIIGARIPGRFDLTFEKSYSLSQATKKSLSDLKDVVNITMYSTSQLPAKYQPVLRDTKDILSDYKTFGKGNIILTYKDPSKDEETKIKALQSGVREVQFNVIGDEEFQVKNGFLGLVVSYAGKNESIPFIEGTESLEYQLTSFIKKLTITEKAKVGFFSGFGQTVLKDHSIFTNELSSQYEFSDIVIDDKNKEIPADLKALIVSGPKEKFSEDAQKALEKYLADGGSVLFLSETMNANPQTMSSAPIQDNISAFLENYGISARQNVVYDLRSNETVSFGGGAISYLLPYPFWLRAVPADKTSQIVSQVDSVVLPWANSLSLNEDKIKEKGFSSQVLLKTTEYGGVLSGNSISLRPDQQFSQTGLGENNLAVSLISNNENENKKKTRIVAIGESDFLTDAFAQNFPESLAFATESLSWLAQEDSLAGIKLKQLEKRNLVFKDSSQSNFVKYGNMAFAFFVPLAFGAWRIWQRKNLRKKVYKV